MKSTQFLFSIIVLFQCFRQETDELKKQIHGFRIQFGCLEEQLRNSQQDMARYIETYKHFLK